MKRVRKSGEPAGLTKIVQTHPQAKWDDPVVRSARRAVGQVIDEQIDRAKARGKTLDALVASFFSDDANWPEFFTVYLIRLGAPAMKFLQRSQYRG